MENKVNKAVVIIIIAIMLLEIFIPTVSKAISSLEVSVSYSSTSPTNGDVEVTIEASAKLEELD